MNFDAISLKGINIDEINFDEISLNKIFKKLYCPHSFLQHTKMWPLSM